MAISCPTHFDVQYLREQVRKTYDQVAQDPSGEFHFHRGPDYAVRYLGYDRTELAALPERATSRFAGVGNPISIGPFGAGETVLDHACGAGMDLLLAARRIGPGGIAIGVDMTAGMRQNASAAAQEAGMRNIVIREGVYEDLPVDDESVDVVISNGVINLAPDKEIVLREIVRVLKPGGRLYLADVIVQRELSLSARSNPDLWAACVGGALVEPELYRLVDNVGMVAGSVVRRFNCFLETSAERKVSSDLFVHSVNFFARKPE